MHPRILLVKKFQIQETRERGKKIARQNKGGLSNRQVRTLIRRKGMPTAPLNARREDEPTLKQGGQRQHKVVLTHNATLER